MYSRKYCVSCLVICLCIKIGFAQPVEYEAVGPKETEQLEKELLNKLAGYNCAFWPKEEKLKNAIRGENISKKYIDNIRNWLPRILNSELIPQKMDPNSWLGVNNLYVNRNCVLGKFYSEKDPNTSIEFKGRYNGLDITIHSNQFFNKTASEIQGDKIKEIINKVLLIPKEKQDKIVIDSHVESIANYNICYGKLFCEWTEKSNPFEKERCWWSYIPFWYMKGLIYVSILTIEKGELPRSTFGEQWQF